jgi:hypothetical protein
MTAPSADRTAGKLLGALTVLLVSGSEISAIALLPIVPNAGWLLGRVFGWAWGFTGRKSADRGPSESTALVRTIDLETSDRHKAESEVCDDGTKRIRPMLRSLDPRKTQPKQ